MSNFFGFYFFKPGDGVKIKGKFLHPGHGQTSKKGPEGLNMRDLLTGRTMATQRHRGTGGQCLGAKLLPCEGYDDATTKGGS